MSQSLEERLRAHFADRAAREPLPGPEGDAALERARGAGEPGAVGVDRRADGRRTGRVLPFVRRRPVLVAAAAVVVLAVAAGLVAVDDERTRVSTDPTPAPTAPPDTSPGSTSRSTSNTTAPPSAGDRPTGPIVGVEGILGSWSGSGWVPWEPGATPPDGDEYKIVRLDQPIATRAGAATAQVCGTVPIIDVGLHYTGNRLDPLPIAVAGVSDPRPRAVEVLDPSAPVYREAAAAVVAGFGIDDSSPQVVQVVRGDLDADGTAEVVVVAERLADVTGQIGSQGDYSVAFLRRAVGGQVRTTVLARSIVEPRPGFIPVATPFRVGALADLNGDGRMEIVLGSRYYEGSTTLVHELRSDGSVPEVLQAECGV